MEAKRALFRDFLEPESVETQRWYSGGTHLSAIIKFILRNLDPDTYGQPVDEGTRRLWELGFAAEDAIGRAFGRRFWGREKSLVSQCRVERDGVRMSIDWFDLAAWSVYESKYTRMTSNRDIRDVKMRHYLWQIKAYCDVMEALTAKLVVVHAMGDYTQGSPVTPYEWSLKFKAHELDNNWRMILGNKRRMEEERQ